MSSTFKDRKKFATVLGKRMAYIDEGTGDPIVFVHGNPTSSFLWRNIMPHLSGMGRLIAIDLIGMGDSDKLDNSGPDSYTIKEHSRYVAELLSQLDVKDNVTLVCHDWGVALSCHWAFNNKAAVKGIAFMEGRVMPLPTWDYFPEKARAGFKAMRTAAGEEMILRNNMFVEKMLPGSVMRTLSDEEMDEYKRPFVNPGEDRRPTLTFPRQVPVEGFPEDVHDLVSDYSQWLLKDPLPKLFINADPGVLITGRVRDFVRSWENLTEVTVTGLHFIQEDSPDDIGQAIRSWLSGL
ncbi:haloalkane dehalogenase [Granulosicoccus antarcticus]|nr:haloalkane dehalogenase [Granulosicoccus antarcticus]